MSQRIKDLVEDVDRLTHGMEVGFRPRPETRADILRGTDVAAYQGFS